MYCPECGAKNEDNAVFCENCGARLLDVDTGSYNASDIDEQNTKMYGGRNSTMDTQVYGSSNNSGRNRNAGKGFSLSGVKKSEWISMAVALIAVIVCIILFNVLYGAKQVAQRYTEAALTGDWSTVYDCITHENSGTFMTKQLFVTAQTISNDTGYDACTITSVTKGADELSDKTYSVAYETADGSDVMTVTLKRNGLFWEVQDTKYINELYLISVPAGSTVSVDKVELSGKYKTGTENNLDTYAISPIYGKSHYVKVSGSGLEDTAQIVTADSTSPTQVQVRLDENTAATVAKQAEEDLKSLLEAAARNQNVSSVSAVNNMSSDSMEDAIYEYEYVRDTVFGYKSNNKELVSYELSDMEAYVYTMVDSSGADFLQVDIKADATLIYNKVNSWFGNGEQTETGSCTNSLYYKRNGTAWLLYSIDLNM